MSIKNHIKAKIENAKYIAEESIQLYNDNSPLRLCLLGIPTLGPVIDTILTSKGQKISYDRLLNFIHELENEIKEIDDQLINLEFINSEEFYDLLVKSIEVSLKTRHEEKRKLFAKIIKNRCVVQNSDLNPEFYLEIINELTIEELIVAKKLYEIKTAFTLEELAEKYKVKPVQIKQDKDALALVLSDFSIDKDDYTFILLRLQKAGLIKEETGNYFGNEGGIYHMTKTFGKLIANISN